MKMSGMRAWTALVALALLAACGTGGEDGPPPFEIQAIGPAGGNIAAGDVFVSIPTGALTQLTQVTILPELNPLPFVVDPQDPCMYDFLGPLWCVGPVGHNLAIAAVLEVRYDPALIPPGALPDDLVLFLWDEAAMVLRLEMNAVHDIANHTFRFNDYVQLGHLAIMVRTCQMQPQIPAFGFIAGRPPQPPPLTTDGGTAAPGLYVADADADLNVNPPVQLPIANAVPEFIQPSPDGTQILYGVDDTRGGVDLFNTTVAGGGPIPLAGMPLGFAGFEGWWANTGGSTDVFHYLDAGASSKPGSGEASLVGPGRNNSVFSVEPAVGTGPITPFHGIPDGTFFDDLRQAPGGAHILVRYFDSLLDPGTVIEIVDAATGLITSGLSTGTRILANSFANTPRFTANGAGVVHIDQTRTQAIQTDLTGGNPVTIYAVNFPFEIVDFAPSPDGVHFFAIVRENFGTQSPIDSFVLGLMAGGAGQTPLEVESTNGSGAYFEVVWHPDARHVYVDFEQQVPTFARGVLPISIDPALADPNRIVVHPTIPTQIDGVDVSTMDGRLLVTISQQIVGSDTLGKIGPPPSTQFTSNGVWVSAPDGSMPRLVIDVLDSQGIFRPARWLRSWRTVGRTNAGLFGGVR